MDTLANNLRFAFRSLRKNPGFTAIVLLTLALGIGANTAIWSVVRSVVLRPLPYPEADRVVRVWPRMTLSIEYGRAFEEETRSFSALSIFSFTQVSFTGEGRPEQLFGIEVTPGHFDVLGVAPALGRPFVPEEREVGHDAVVILSHRLWQSRFGGDAQIVGRRIALNGRERVVVGVMPADFKPLDSDCDIWLPLAADPGSEGYSDWFIYSLLARVAPGMTHLEAETDVRRLAVRLREKNRDLISTEAARTAQIVPLLDWMVGSSVRTTLSLLFGAAGLVLLIACTNIANLLLARAGARHREVIVRSALGAGRRRLLAQFLTESLVLALVGGLLGVFVAAWSVALLSEKLASSLPRLQEIHVDPSAFLFALGASLLSGLLFGLVPAYKTSRPDLQAALRSGGRATTERHHLQFVLVAAEIALAVVLVAGAGLLVKSFWELRQVDTGFNPDHLLTLRIQAPGGRYDDDPKRRIYFEAVRDRLAAAPGVVAVGAISHLPMRPGEVKMPYLASPVRSSTGEPPPATTVRIVTPDFMETFGVPLIAGRQLELNDRGEAATAGLVNLALARRAWGEEDPVGKKLYYDDGSLWLTVVGVVGDIRQHRLDLESAPQVYLPLAQRSWSTRMYFAVRATVPPEALVPAVEEAVWSIDRDVPITGVALMDDVIYRSMTDRRELMRLFALFAALALVLGAIGVYGVTSFLVSQRAYETGVRMALGATGPSVVLTNLRRVMAPVAIGLGVGLSASWGAAQLIERQLFQVRTIDPAVSCVVVVFLGGIAALAGYLPARKAARVDPMVILGAD